MSKKVAFFVLILAIFSGLIASATVVRFVRQLNQPSRQGAPTLEHVVMSTQKIAVGEKLTLRKITLTQRKNGNIPQGAITKLEEAVDKTAKSTIFPGEMLLSQRLAQAGASGNLAAKIPAGHRAITLRVDDSSGVAGFIQPGCMVDVLSTFDTQGGNDSLTKVILQNVKVLAKGRQTDIREVNPQTKRIPSVTLLVTLSQAETLSLASNSGTIRLVLRSTTDTKEELTQGASLGDLLAKEALSPPSPQPVFTPVPSPTPTPFHTVELIRGNEKKDLTFPIQ